ncbi:Mitochondrial glutamate carrier 2 [Acropora cervicornis]|uniref:Mitochondrial glutamate carrier 2 n=1 Tax=Acropora cervicornis TaxID=6130 RepID=A0AAD9V8P9_ACRCE|nr:Mitochondrial glutamate carrier 2 [Acropora cervicornis]
MDCLWKVAKAEGARGLYKGIGVNLLLINPEKAIKLAVNDQVIITTPMEMLKIQLQMAGTQNLADSPMTPNTTTAVAAASSNVRTFGTKSGTLPKSAAEIAQDVLRSKGVRGLYKGLGATLARDVPFSCIYFPLFSFLRLEFQPVEGPSPPHSLLAGCVAGMIGSLAVTPMDVVKTRLQVLRNAQGEAAYSGIVDCVQKTYTNEGIMAFYKGAVPRMIVIAPLFGIAQMVYFLGVAEWMIGWEV